MYWDGLSLSRYILVHPGTLPVPVRYWYRSRTSKVLYTYWYILVLVTVRPYTGTYQDR